MKAEILAAHLEARWNTKQCLWRQCQESVPFRTGRGPKAHFCSPQHKALYSARRSQLQADQARIDRTLASENLDPGLRERLLVMRQAVNWQLTTYTPPGRSTDQGADSFQGK